MDTTITSASQPIDMSPLPGEELAVCEGKCLQESGAIVQKLIQYASSLTNACEHGSHMQTLAKRMNERQLLLEELHGKGFISRDGEREVVNSIVNLMEEFQKEHRTLMNKVFNGVLTSCP